jgi:mannan endo-1,4-beta-mannosidase
MATYTKSIDENHLLEVGMEGFYGNSIPEKLQRNPPWFNQVGTDYIRTNLIKEIDFATIHAYPDLWYLTRIFIICIYKNILVEFQK